MGNVTQRIEQQSNGTAWKNLWRYQSIFDASSQLDTQYTSKWDSVGEAWKIEPTRVCYNYSEGLMTEKLIEARNGDSWTNGTRVQYSYDSLDRIVAELIQNWSYVDGTQQRDWQDFSRWLYRYGSSGSLDTAMNENWDTTTASWQSYARHLYQYDSSQRLAVDIEQRLDPTWQEWWRTSYSYTADGDTAQRVFHKSYNGTSEDVFTFTYSPPHRKISELEVLDGTNRRRTTWLYDQSGCISIVISETDLSWTTQNQHGWDSTGISIYGYEPLQVRRHSAHRKAGSPIGIHARGPWTVIDIAESNSSDRVAAVQIRNLSGRLVGACELHTNGKWYFPTQKMSAGGFVVSVISPQLSASSIILRVP
jgi:hypothetical protein